MSYAGERADRTGVPLRPRLALAGPPHRRTDGSIQLGLEPGRGLVLDGLTDADTRLLARLDGTVDRDLLLAEHAEATAAPTAGAAGSPTAGSDLLGLLASAGALAPARGGGWRRATARVVVDGTGPLPAALAELLREAGVGTVAAGAYAVDLATSGSRDTLPDVVVLVVPAPAVAARTTPLRARGIPHVVVAADGHHAVVGPLVRPGISACMECVEQSRSDRDPDWPVIRARAAGAAIGPPQRVGGDPALVALVASMAALVVLAEAEGQCPGGVSLEVSLPWPRVVQRRWDAHPSCSCGAATRASTRVGGQWSA